MRVVGSSFHAWESMERQEGIRVPHGLVFSLATVAAIGSPHGLDMTAEESVDGSVVDFDAVFISVLDSRCMIGAASHFAKWKVPFRRAERLGGKYPMIWCGGQGLHNPLPLSDVFDLCIVGDAEDPLPTLLVLWERHGNTNGFLSAAATVPGVYVPAHHRPGEATIVQSIATTIDVSLRDHIDVSHNRTRRIEIARGCKYKCAFCSLGWRAPVRENSAGSIIQEIRRSGKLVHLQAGDAESHSQIDDIRVALREHGGHDQGWTGRLDTLLANPDQMIPGQKRYAFGVEGVSTRLRSAFGKSYLTDRRLIDDTCTFFESIEGDGKGRAAWHLISGLPTERPREALELGRVVSEINSRRAGKISRNLSIHWQPFQPLPGTPAQWFGCGSGARKLAGLLRPFEALPWCRVRQQTGRTDAMAKICTVLARSDRRGASLLERLSQGSVTPDVAVDVAGVTFGELDTGAPLVWDFVRHAYSRETLTRAHATVVRRLRTDAVCE